MPDDPSSRPAKGEVVVQSFDHDGVRQVAVYIPPEHAEAIVFAGDGQLISTWGSVLETADVPPTMIVGAYRTDDMDEMARIREYSPSFDPDLFASHEHFFVDEIREWVRTRFDITTRPEKTAVCGVSASAELALALGLRHPDVYGAVFCASPGAGYRPPAQLPPALPRAYFVAGLQEPFFLENAKRWATALRNAGGEVVFEERDGGHGDSFWAAEFPRMVRWAFT